MKLLETGKAFGFKISTPVKGPHITQPDPTLTMFHELSKKTSEDEKILAP